MSNVIPFPADKIVRLFRFGKLANYCGLQVNVLADGGPNALVEYDGKRGWVPRGSLRDWVETMSGGKPADTE